MKPLSGALRVLGLTAVFAAHRRRLQYLHNLEQYAAQLVKWERGDSVQRWCWSFYLLYRRDGNRR